MKIENFKLKISLLILIFSLLHFKAHAQEMRSQNFTIQGGNLNMTSGVKSSAQFKLSDVVGQTSAGIFSSKGYFIQSGFLNSAAGEVFSFSVSPAIVDFGSLIPNNPVERNVRISIANGDVEGYSVSVAESQPLSTQVKAEIVDTVCDDKDTPCTYTQAAKWAESTSYGFGYRISGKSVPSDFKEENFFRPFPAISRNEQPILSMQSNEKKAVDQATMMLRVNISRNQPVGQYRNVLNFTAVAGI